MRTAGTVNNLTVLEDAATTSLGLGTLAYSPGPANESSQTLTYTVTAVPAAALGDIVLANGTTVVTTSTTYSLAQLQGMQFRAAANANGGPATFSWRVTDNGGTANGGVNTLAESLTINVTAVNDAPSAADSTVAVVEDGSRAFAAGDFGFSDVDTGDTLSAVRIDTLSIPVGATLRLSGVDVVATQVIAAANFGNLVFTPATNANGVGYASFTFSVCDTGGPAFDAAPNTMTINVTAVNDAPVAVNDSYTVAEDSTLTVGWWDTDWTRRQQITFNNTNVGGFAPAETLSNFPVLLVLDSTKVDYTLTQDDGGDLRFFDADGTPLAYEIERWDEAGNSYVWVKVPQIDIGATDSIPMYYGNAAVADGEDPSAVWAGTGYRSVYHLDDAGPTVEDATSTNYDGSAMNGATAASLARSASHTDSMG